MKKHITGILIFLIMSLVFSFDPSYQHYDSLLQETVCKGGVQYKRLLDKPRFEAIKNNFEHLSRKEFDGFSEKGKLAFLINVYNFYTIELIVDNYPLKNGIRDIRKPWGQEFIPLFGEKVSLDYVEHTLIRKYFDEPRIHFAVVCASVGCPPLLDRAYTAENLDTQLDKAAKIFLTDSSKNYVKKNRLYLSKIFQWYGDDFNNKHGSFKNYIKEVLDLTGKYRVTFLEYDWSLNEFSGCM